MKYFMTIQLYDEIKEYNPKLYITDDYIHSLPNFLNMIPEAKTQLNSLLSNIL